MAGSPSSCSTATATSPPGACSGSGLVRSIAWRGEPHLLVALGEQTLLERFEDGLATDHAVTLGSAMPQNIWQGLGHLEGREVVVEGAGTQARTTSPEVPLRPRRRRRW